MCVYIISPSITASSSSPTEGYDDESAYYSEIGTAPKRGTVDQHDMHYASRSVTDTNFYHIVEESETAPPIPLGPPVTFGYQLPGYPLTHTVENSYQTNNNRYIFILFSYLVILLFTEYFISII